MAEQTVPGAGRQQSAPHLLIEPSYTAPDGSTYVHKDYVQALHAWTVEQHIPPIHQTERFGDVESWAAYLALYSVPEESLLTWSEGGLKAVLDYHQQDTTPGRCQWLAEHPFERSHQWRQWSRIADGTAKSQKAVLEALEDLSEDIVAPDAAQLLTVLRTLRATSMASADTELKPDGSTHVVWTKSNAVKAAELDLPPEFQIAVPVLKGHTAPTEDGKLTPVLYRLAVRVRVNVDDQAHLSIRLTMPGAERVLEAVYADRVAAAAVLLGDERRLLRATDR